MRTETNYVVNHLRNTIKSIVIVGVFSFVLKQSALGQLPTPDLSDGGELVFMLSDQVSDDFNVQVDLNGPVFNEQGNYRDSVAVSHPDISKYGMKLWGGNTVTVNQNRRICTWESADANDTPARQDRCGGMIGWGRYKVTISNTTYGTFSFDVNYVDGNWMRRQRNEIVIYINIENGSMKLYYYNWGPSAGWNNLVQDAELRIWRICAAPRNRDELANGLLFKIGDAVDPFYPRRLSNVTLDVNLYSPYRVRIPAGKELHISEYDNDTSKYSTTWRFIYTSGVSVESYQINSGKIAISADNINGVRMLPKQTDGKYWQGISLIGTGQESSTNTMAYLHNVLIDSAKTGVQLSSNSRLEMTNSFIRRCIIGINCENSIIDVFGSRVDTSITTGIFLKGKTNYGPFKSRIQYCWIDSSGTDGVKMLHANKFGVSNGSTNMVYYNEIVKYNLIKDSYIRRSYDNGVRSEYSWSTIRENNISLNGKVFEPATVLKQCGIFGTNCFTRIHGNDFTSNGSYGAHINYAGVFYGSIYPYSDPNDDQIKAEENKGNNCFDDNSCSVGTNYQNGQTTNPNEFSTVFFGGPRNVFDPEGPFTNNGYGNSFKNPRMVDNMGIGINATVDNNSVCYVEKNFWLPYNWYEAGDGEIYPGSPTSDPDDVRCGEPYNPGNKPVVKDPDSLLIESIYYSVLSRNWQDASDYAVQVDEASDGPVCSMYGIALHHAYSFGQIPDARQILWDRAMRPKNPGDTLTDIERASFLYLMQITSEDGDLETFVRINDTLSVRSIACQDYDYAILAKRNIANVYGQMWHDTTTALNIYAELMQTGAFPYSYDVLSDYIAITLDKDARLWYLPKRAVSSSSTTVPKRATLNKNYPNPFNPTTEIIYGIPEPGSVKLSVYDNLGREVKILVREYQDAGTYTVQFNADQLPSGMYLYKIETPAGTLSRKMMLMK